jgi:hypothetical protein
MQLSLTPEEKERLSAVREFYVLACNLLGTVCVNSGCGIAWIYILKPAICYAVTPN